MVKMRSNQIQVSVASVHLICIVAILVAVTGTQVDCHTITARSESNSDDKFHNNIYSRAALSVANHRIRRSGVGLTTTSCDVRSSCDVKSAPARQLTFAERNCFCDDLCTAYQDCCADYVPGKVGGERGERGGSLLLSTNFIDTVACERVLEIDADREIYIVMSCPKGFTDVFVRTACENVDGMSGVGEGTDIFRQLPVTSRSTGVLYRNFFCSICAGDSNVTFWLARVSCSDAPRITPGGSGTGGGGRNPSSSASSSLTPQELVRATLRHDRQADCETEYRHPDASFTTRGCKSHIGRCDRRWTSVGVSRQCRASTSYVYAGLRTFRNVYCARCNFVNMSYVGCDDHRTLIASAPTPADDVMTTPVAPFSVTVDLNTAVAIVQRRRSSLSGVTTEISEVGF